MIGKIFAGIALFLVMISPAVADHLEKPYVGQVRFERVTICNTVDNLVKLANTNRLFDDGLTTDQVKEYYRNHFDENCNHKLFEYEVLEILSIETFKSISRDGEWGGVVPYYILRVHEVDDNQELTISTF